MAELVVAEAELLGGAALVEAAGGERLAQQGFLVAADARGEVRRRVGRGGMRGRRRCRWRAEGRGEGVEGDGVDRALGLPRAIEGAADRAFDDVAQLADIAGPGVVLERGGRARAEPGEILAAELAAHRAGEMRGEQRDILEALAQRRDGDDIEGEAVEQIGTELSLGGETRQVEIGGADDTYVHLLLGIAADPPRTALLPDPHEPFPVRQRGGCALVP